MQLECKYNGNPVGLIEANSEILFVISELAFVAYRSLYHLEMLDNYKTGTPVFIEIEIAEKSIRVKLLEHKGNAIKIEHKKSRKFEV